MTKYEWREGMGEISGFGGDYEARCREMLIGGLDWLDANPESNPVFKKYQNVVGVVTEDNEDARKLAKAIEIAGNDDFSGAMFSIAVNHCLYIKKNGWEQYCQEMIKRNS